MKTRMRFTKTGSVKFIGHLDCMRFFQKAFRRTGLHVAYTKGFSPHQIMSFASPLSVGTTSDGEYIDVTFESLPDVPESELIARINACMTDEIFVTEFQRLDDKAKPSMALLYACDYMISFRDGGTFCGNTEAACGMKPHAFSLRETFSAFMEQDSIPVVKKTKRSEKELDLKSFIQCFAFSGAEFEEKTGEALPALHNEYDSEDELYLRLASGSVENIKPELVIRTYMDSMNLRLKQFSYQVHRIQMYFKET